MTEGFYALLRQVQRDLTLPDGMWLRVSPRPEDRWLQVEAILADNLNPASPPASRTGRKWRLSVHMTKSELVRTIFMACLAFQEHELRERFRYRGMAIFGPHIDVDALAETAEAMDRRGAA